MFPIFLTKQGFILANAISRNGKYSDLCHYTLTVSEEMLLQFVCCPHDCDHFSSIPKSLAKLTASAYTD